MKYIRTFLTALCLCALLCSSALAANEGFNAGLDVDRSIDGVISVTVANDDATNAILAEHTPTLSVPCDFAYAAVTHGGTKIDCTVANGTVSFVVAVGGTYTITEAAAPVVTHTVTFGGLAPDQTVEHGKTASVPAAPTKAGCTFGGWYCDEELTEAYDFSAEVTADIALYPKWVLKCYTVIFDPNGGSCDTASVSVEHGSTLGELPVPTRRGYWEFVGWYTAPSGGTEVTAETVITGNTTVYAQWYYDEPYVPVVPTTSTETTENDDGSTTTTVTNNRTGTVTETTENTDGSVTTVETKKNGTVTETVENTDGSTVTTVTEKDGSSVTVAELADGTTATITTDTDGKTETEVVISEEAVLSGTTVALPIPAVEHTNDSETASAITVTTNSKTETSVAIPVAEVSTSTVAVLVNEDGTETVITETKMTENGLVIDVPDGAVVKVVDNAISFTDVSDADWEQEAVNFASARGLVNGVGNDTFDLDSKATRGQVMTLLARLAGVDTTPGEGQMWYDKGREWAMANGISDGTNVDKAITRDEMMTMLWRLVGAPESDHDIGHFTDAHELSPWTEEAARWAIEIGLVQGHGNGTMTPKSLTTRGQLAQFMMNFIQLM